MLDDFVPKEVEENERWACIVMGHELFRGSVFQLRLTLVREEEQGPEDHSVFINLVEGGSYRGDLIRLYHELMRAEANRLFR